jgi:phosphoribosyl 1,2-cyclic phosphate phosphodiesterase
MGKKIQKVRFLGTGTSQGIPVIGCDCEVCQSSDERDKRLRCSLLVESEEAKIVIDIGPDFRTQMLNARIGVLDAVLLTHEHNDHIIGMDDIRPFNFRQGRPMEIYGLSRVIADVRERFGYVFSEKPYPGAPRISTKEMKAGEIISIKDLSIQSLEVLHGKLPILGFRMEDFAYLTDVKYLPDATLQGLLGLHTLVLSALHHREHHSHMTLAQAVELAKKIGAQRTYFVHMSHFMGLHASVNQNLPEGMYLAHDGLELNFKERQDNHTPSR